MRKLQIILSGFIGAIIGYCLVVNIWHLIFLAIILTPALVPIFPLIAIMLGSFIIFATFAFVLGKVIDYYCNNCRPQAKPEEQPQVQNPLLFSSTMASLSAAPSHASTLESPDSRRVSDISSAPASVASSSTASRLDDTPPRAYTPESHSRRVSDISLAPASAASPSSGVGPTPQGVSPSSSGVGPTPQRVSPSSSGVGPTPQGVSPSSSGVGPTPPPAASPNSDSSNSGIGGHTPPAASPSSGGSNSGIGGDTSPEASPSSLEVNDFRIRSGILPTPSRNTRLTCSPVPCRFLSPPIIENMLITEPHPDTNTTPLHKPRG